MLLSMAMADPSEGPPFTSRSIVVRADHSNHRDLTDGIQIRRVAGTLPSASKLPRLIRVSDRTFRRQ